MTDAKAFDKLHIGLATAQDILDWSFGEVKKPETINYRTLKPERDGLFCERIFGPTRDWECACGKYKRVRYKGIVCERCGVEVTRSKVRRQRMGHIELAAPVTHIWYFKGVPSRLGYLLNLAPKDLEKVIYFAAYMITEVDEDGRREDLPNLMEEMAHEKAQTKQRIEERITRRQQKLEDDLAALEKDKAKQSEKDKVKRAAERELTQLRKKLDSDIERLEEIFERFRDLKVGDLEGDEMLYRDMVMRYGIYFKGDKGANAVKKRLENFDLEKEAVALRETIESGTGQRKSRALKRLKVVNAFLSTSTSPVSMVLDRIPVIPPDLRPMVQLDGGRFATSDLNDLYRRVINRNNRLKRLLDLGAPEIIVNNEKRMLQESVDALFDNGRRGRAVTGPGNRPLKSLSDMLKGKQGRFRQNLLGKRVDYSGRSVIVVGPQLSLHECGLPKQMALELFKPFVMKRLVERQDAQNVKAAKRMVERQRPQVWDVLDEAIAEHPVLLNRAPTLHRLSIQAFEPVLIEGKAIQLHPLVCAAFNADFDGDQMAVHLPLSAEAQAEARILMLSSNNILRPSDGRPVTMPSQDMIIGVYHLTANEDPQARGGLKHLQHEGGDKAKAIAEAAAAASEKAASAASGSATSGSGASGSATSGSGASGSAISGSQKAGSGASGSGASASSSDNDVTSMKYFASPAEARMAFDLGELDINETAMIEFTDIVPPTGWKAPEGWSDGDPVVLATSMGRCIFNEALPANFPFVNKQVDKKGLGWIVNTLAERYDKGNVGASLDALKNLGFHWATWSGITVSFADIISPEDKWDIIANYDERAANVQMQYDIGAISAADRYRELVDIWNECTGAVLDSAKKSFPERNNIYRMVNSGARGNWDQVRQIAAMRGLVADPKQKLIEEPIKSNYREGLSVLEYFIATHGARKGLADTALRTADSGYLTRRLVDVSQDVIVRDEDCGTKRGITIPIAEPLEAEADAGAAGSVAGAAAGGAASDSADSGSNAGSNSASDSAPDAVKPRVRKLDTVETTVYGRTLSKDAVDADGKVIAEKGADVGDELIEKLVDAGITELHVRSVLTCESQVGTCASCYGRSLATGKRVDVGEAVGIVAAQSIGEPGTQLTMRTFHTGGAAGAADITQGLPRVQELFEARTPKGEAVMAEAAGTVKIIDEPGTPRRIVITRDDGQEDIDLALSRRLKLLVADGQHVGVGTQITEGRLDPKKVLRILGINATQKQLVNEVQEVYRSQGVDIHSKHIEVIVRQMLRRITVLKSGSTKFLPGELVDSMFFRAENRRVVSEGGQPAAGRPELMGITKASLATDSWLSAASFQETTKVLTEAGLNSKKDPLVGLKENVIIGKLIPAGTGLDMYSSAVVEPTEEAMASNGWSPEDFRAPEIDEDFLAGISFDDSFGHLRL